MSQGTLSEFRDVSVDPRGGPRRVGGPSVSFRLGRGTRGEVLNGSGTICRSGTGRWTVGEVQNGSGENWGGPERVGGPTARSVTGRGTLG